LSEARKALTLYQPWASLVAVGAKTIETRPWSTSYRGELWIHAGKRRMNLDDGSLKLWWQYREKLESQLDSRHWETLPYGQVIARAQLMTIVPTSQCSRPSYFEIGYGDLPDRGWDMAIPEHDDGDDTVLISDANAHCGNFDHGRFAWLLDDVEELPWDERVEARGAQRIWNWQL
jgi:hypothetical protein